MTQKLGAGHHTMALIGAFLLDVYFVVVHRVYPTRLKGFPSEKWRFAGETGDPHWTHMLLSPWCTNTRGKHLDVHSVMIYRNIIYIYVCDCV